MVTGLLSWQVLSPEDCMHAVSQGALAVECRTGDEATLQLLSELQDLDSALACVAERAFLKKLVGTVKSDFFFICVCCECGGESRGCARL